MLTLDIGRRIFGIIKLGWCMVVAGLGQSFDNRCIQPKEQFVSLRRNGGYRGGMRAIESRVETLFNCIAMELGYHKSGCALGGGTRRKAPENTTRFYEIT